MEPKKGTPMIITAFFLLLFIAAGYILANKNLNSIENFAGAVKATLQKP